MKPYKNLMAPQSSHSFATNNMQLSQCSLEMFRNLPRESSDWSCLVDEELLYQRNDNTPFYVLGSIIFVLGVLLCHPKDLLAPWCPGHTRVGRTYSTARRY